MTKEIDTASEFGKGLVICLVKFAEHRWRWHSTKEQYAHMREKSPHLFSISDAIEMHFNGASDHLYEIEVPKEWENTELETKVKELQDSCLAMGHGFSGKKWTEEDMNRAYDLCHEIALLLDKQIGLQPQRGAW